MNTVVNNRKYLGAYSYCPSLYDHNESLYLMIHDDAPHCRAAVDSKCFLERIS